MEITNEMIYAQLGTINTRLDQMEQRLDQIDKRLDQLEASNQMIRARLDQADKRFDQQEANSAMMFDFFKDFKAAVNREFDQVNRRLDQIEQRQEEDHKMLMDLWQHRENMKIGFSGKLLAINGISSGLIAVVVSIFTNAIAK